MRYYSTNNRNNFVSLQKAVLEGMPRDMGLYMPESIPQMPEKFFHDLSTMNFQEISFEIAKKFLDNDVPAREIERIIEEALNFDIPLVNLHDNVNVLELFHGPTLAFKDVGARFMSRLMSYLIKDSDEILNIIVATSGDTGSAVANGFYQVAGTQVFVLYPSRKVSEIQEKQLATLGENIIALEIDGTFDDCQKLAKQALCDEALTQRMMLTSANSVNISRLIPQSFYYFYAYSQLKLRDSKKVVISVPSGNFGNLVAGLIAKKMGLPIYKFVASTNVNSVVPEYLETGEYRPRPSIHTLSNAMDVGNPSNFARMLDLYDHSWKNIRADVLGANFDDEKTRDAIKTVFEKYGYIMDPHGAVGYLGLMEVMGNDPETEIGIFIETAHPVKFIDIVEPVIDTKIEIPERLEKYLKREILSIKLPNNYDIFKEYLLS